MRAASQRRFWFQGLVVVAIGVAVLVWVCGYLWPPDAWTPPGQSPPGPGQRPPGPGQSPPGQSPPGQSPPGPGQRPPGQSPPGQSPPGPGQSPPGQSPSGPPGQTPPGPPDQSPPGQSSPGPTQANRCLQPDTEREKVPLVAVSGTNTLLISAYLDLRARPEVRIIAVALRKEHAAYRCLLCCQGQPYMAAGAVDVHSDHFGFDYGTADVFCPLPAGCPDPSHVAVSGVAAPTETLSQEEEEPRFLLVQNRQPITKDFPHQFTICLSTMFDFTNVLQLVQSMEMLRLLGVTQVVLYKTSCSADTQKLLDHYERTGFLEVIPWSMASRLNVSRSWRPDLGAGQLHYYGQLAALNDCVYRNMYRSRYLGLHDMDELILPQAVDSWTELLPQLELKHGPGHSYIFMNYVFPNSIPGTPPAPSSEARPTAGWQDVEGVNILDHLYHEPPDTLTWSNHKIIVDPRAVVRPSVHGLLEPRHITVAVPPSVARMYHTRAAVKAGLTRNNLKFDGRLLDYRDRLVRVVDEVLERTGLLHPSREGPPLGD